MLFIRNDPFARPKKTRLMLSHSISCFLCKTSFLDEQVYENHREVCAAAVGETLTLKPPSSVTTVSLVVPETNNSKHFAIYLIVS